MTTYETYTNRYSKSREKKVASVSPQTNLIQSPSIANQQPRQSNDLGKVMSKLTDRIDGLQIKITSLTNIVKLLQKYTQTRDEQYQKQKQNTEYGLTLGSVPQIIPESLQLRDKIKQIEGLSQKMKSQISAMQTLRIGISRENSQKYLVQSPSQFNETPANQIQTSNQSDIFIEVQAMIADMEDNLREELNKKIQVCMKCLKQTVQQFSGSYQTKEFASPKTVHSMNNTMLQEQLHNLTLAMNKIENDCNRNKIITDQKIDEVVSYISEIKKRTINNRITTDKNTIQSQQSKRQISRSKSRSANKSQWQATRQFDQQDKSENSSISKRSKSINRKHNQKSKSGHQTSSRSIIQEQKKIKQNQLKEALRRKKENQEKLKMLKK